ncbi:MAG: endosialidase [Lachnospiraceae bacterium]|nr:endosialidase [Lachnospiraceae bacterium]MBR5944722.1 endosialidase [Lachnospiraceae bacterium]
MAEQLIRVEADGSISFGDYKLSAKSKLEDFPHSGDLYKVKTFNEITKLEKNSGFLYESVPGTSVSHFTENENGVEFSVSGDKDAQITIGLAEDTEYDVFLDGENTGSMSTGLSGKLSLSVELSDKGSVKVRISKK